MARQLLLFGLLVWLCPWMAVSVDDEACCTTYQVRIPSSGSLIFPSIPCSPFPSLLLFLSFFLSLSVSCCLTHLHSLLLKPLKKISGAGTASVNGLYKVSNQLRDGVLSYTQDGGKFTLLRFRFAQKGHTYWYISHLHELAQVAELGFGDKDYYRIRSSADVPPAGPYKDNFTEKKGIGSAPRVHCISMYNHKYFRCFWFSWCSPVVPSSPFLLFVSFILLFPNHS